MADRTDHVLQSIDGALTDYSGDVSNDAMRWTPDDSPVVPFGLDERACTQHIFDVPHVVLSYRQDLREQAEELHRVWERIFRESAHDLMAMFMAMEDPGPDGECCGGTREEV